MDNIETSKFISKISHYTLSLKVSYLYYKHYLLRIFIVRFVVVCGTLTANIVSALIAMFNRAKFNAPLTIIYNDSPTKELEIEPKIITNSK